MQLTVFLNKKRQVRVFISIKWDISHIYCLFNRHLTESKWKIRIKKLNSLFNRSIPLLSF